MLTISNICDILIADKRIVVGDPVVKGKPFERMGHKALEPKFAAENWRIWLSAARRF